MITVRRKAHFNAAHRLHNKNWDDAKNKAIFGKCNNPNFHGHNYEFTIAVSGEIDPETGFVINLDILKEISKTEVENYMDHKNLNIEVKEFQQLNPTAENIAIVIWNRIKAKLRPDLKLEIELFETPRNSVIYRG